MFSLNRITGNTELHEEVKENKITHLLVRPKLPIFCKLETRGKPTPCQLTFTYPKSDHHKQLNVYSSFTQKLPDATMNSDSFQLPTAITFDRTKKDNVNDPMVIPNQSIKE
jgi:hypothetical protein